MWNLFGVMVLHAAMVDWLGVHLPCIYKDIVLYLLELQVWCSSIQGIYAQLEEGVGVNLP